MLLSTIPTSFLTRNHKKITDFLWSYHQNQVQNALLYFGEDFEEQLLQISQFTADTIRFKVWIINGRIIQRDEAKNIYFTCLK